MEVNQFIFSEKKADRIKRHVFFWISVYLYLSISHAAQPHNDQISFFRNPPYTLAESFLFTAGQVPIVYLMLYLVLPKLYLKKKYIAGFLVTVIIWFLGGVIFFYLFKDVFPWMLSVLPAQYTENTRRMPAVAFFMGVTYMIKGVFTVTSFALGLKFVKHWYLKEQRNLQLQKENTAAQMQLLTAQVHPHFLFNTLNNIFSQTQTESPKGSKMIMGLSDMLRYILYEGQKPLVPLKQELQMIAEYINLEKIRYGNKLDVHVLIPDRAEDIYIAPLLLLPFIENAFKHGTSNMLVNPWINLTIEIKHTLLVMKLMNGKSPGREPKQGNSGIGINNVRKRLELLYKDKYDLQIREEDEVFVVDLKVELVVIPARQESAFMESSSNPAYA